MTVNEYHNKYLDDIRQGNPITIEGLFAQIKEDYSVFRPEEIEYGRAVWRDGGEVVQMAKDLVVSRVSDKPKHIRIVKEYELRNRILYRLFPEAHHRFLDKWETEKMEDMLRSVEYRQWEQRVANGDIFLDKSKRKGNVPEPLEGHAVEIN